MPPKFSLPFEQEIDALEELLAQLEANAGDQLGSSAEVRAMRRDLAQLKHRIYSNLTPWQTIQVARHRERPQTTDYIDLIFDEFVELHGDRAIGDDRAIRTGFARLGDYRVLLVGHQKRAHAQGEKRVSLWLCSSGGLSQGTEQNAPGGEISFANHLFD